MEAEGQPFHPVPEVHFPAAQEGPRVKVPGFFPWGQGHERNRIIHPRGWRLLDIYLFPGEEVRDDPDHLAGAVGDDHGAVLICLITERGVCFLRPKEASQGGQEKDINDIESPSAHKVSRKPFFRVQLNRQIFGELTGRISRPGCCQYPTRKGSPRHQQRWQWEL